MKFALFLIVIISISSCVKKIENPSWIHIDKWQLVSNQTNKEGVLTQNFTDAYVLIDDKIIGFFELPIDLPLLETGSKKIVIYPAIHNNGISATKVIYPFCQPYSLNCTLEKDKTIDIKPSTKYYTNCNFWIEDFEEAGIKIETDLSSTTTLITDNNIKYLKYGNNYGVIPHQKNTLWYGYTKSNLSLPKGGKDVYLEIDYINQIPLLTGVISVNSTDVKLNPNIQLNAQDSTNVQWKKIYIDLKEIISSSVNASYFEQYFKSTVSENGVSGNVYLDNIKIIYR